MIEFDQNVCLLVHTIFKDQYNTPNRKLPFLMEILKLVNTYNVNLPAFNKSVAYWEFMNACLKNIEMGTWVTLPRFWIEYCCASSHLPLTELEAKLEYKKYLANRETILKRLGLPIQEQNDKYVILYWARIKKNDENIMGIAHALLRIYLYFQKGHLHGIENNGAVGPKPLDQSIWPSFDSANLNSNPLVGNNKFEVLKYNAFGNDDRNRMI